MKKNPCSKCPLSADCDGCMFDPSKNQKVIIQVKSKVKLKEYYA